MRILFLFIVAGVLDEDLVIRHLFTLGEIAQLCPAKTPKRVYLIVQSMVAAPCISMAPTQTLAPSQGMMYMYRRFVPV